MAKTKKISINAFDKIVKEPHNGAHRNPQRMALKLKKELLEATLFFTLIYFSKVFPSLKAFPTLLPNAM